MKKVVKKVLRVMGIVAALLIVGGAAFAAVAARRTEKKMSFPDEPSPDIHSTKDPAVIERGRYLVTAVAHCTQCHGDYPRERPQENRDGIALTGGLEFEMGPFAKTWAANLTPTGIGMRTDAQLARTIKTGVMHDGQLSIMMRFMAADLSAEDLTAVISYLRSLPPAGREVPRGGLTFVGKTAFAFFELNPKRKPLPAHVPESAEPSVERGGYLVEHVALCVGCHTTYDPETFEPNGPKAAGGTPEPSHGPDKDKEFAPPNLTSSPKGVTGRLNEDEFVARIHAGRTVVSSVMPWENFGRMTESDLRSIYRYLRSLPPIDRDTGPSYRDIGWKPK